MYMYFLNLISLVICFLLIRCWLRTSTIYIVLKSLPSVIKSPPSGHNWPKPIFNKVWLRRPLIRSLKMTIHRLTPECCLVCVVCIVLLFSQTLPSYSNWLATWTIAKHRVGFWNPEYPNWTLWRKKPKCTRTRLRRLAAFLDKIESLCD